MSEKIQPALTPEQSGARRVVAGDLRPYRSPAAAERAMSEAAISWVLRKVVPFAFVGVYWATCFVIIGLLGGLTNTAAMVVLVVFAWGSAVVAVVGLWHFRQRVRRVRKAFIAVYGIDEIAGLTLREAALLHLDGALTPRVSTEEARRIFDEALRP